MENNQVLLMISSEMGFVLKKEGLVLAKPKYIAKNILVINKKGEITLRPISTAFDGVTRITQLQTGAPAFRSRIPAAR